MSKLIRSSWMIVLFASILATITLAGKPVYGQSAPAIRAGGVEVTGVPEDWSARHVVFSNPGTEQEALQKGEHDHWQKVVNDPRYVIQQLRKNLPIQGPAAVDAEYRSRWISEAIDGRGGLPTVGPRKRFRPPSPTLKRDWAEALGGPGLAAGEYPAKYNVYSTGVASCSDYVVYPTGKASAAGQATIVAFNSVYSGCPLFSGGLPVVYWAITAGTGETATTSPVLSLDGTQVAFVQTTGTAASLVLFKMGSGGGTVTSPTALTAQTSGANYRACTGPCYISYSLGANDTNSAPYVDYSSDRLFVGDDAGKVHLVSGAFLGTPTLDPTVPTGWPVTASTETPHLLYSPILDPGASGRIFVTDTGGYIHSFTAGTATVSPGAVGVAGRMENNTTHVFGPPIIDSSTELVYVFIGYSGDGSHTEPSYINRLPAGTAFTTGNYGTGAYFGNGGANNPATSNMRLGAFDHAYFTGNGSTGNIYACENGVLYQIPLATFTTPTVNKYNTAVSTVGVASACSPVTEFYNTNTSTDWLFLSVLANGNAPSHTGGTALCTGACLYNFNVTTAGTTGFPTAGATATGGTSGIVIDSSSTAFTGDNEIYYTLLGGTSAVQVSQAGLQ